MSSWSAVVRRILQAFTCLVASFPQVAPAQSTVVTAAGERYRAGPLHRLILGQHYRDLWTTKVKVKVLDLETFAGGLHSPSGQVEAGRPGRCDFLALMAASTAVAR